MPRETQPNHDVGHRAVLAMVLVASSAVGSCGPPGPSLGSRDIPSPTAKVEAGNAFRDQQRKAEEERLLQDELSRRTTDLPLDP